MSKPVSPVRSTPVAPVAERVPALAGAWMTTWSVTGARSNSVGEVAASRSLLVYAAPVTPVAAAGAAGGATRVSGGSTTVAAPGVAKGWRRVWASSLTIRRAVAAGGGWTPTLWQSWRA